MYAYFYISEGVVLVKSKKWIKKKCKEIQRDFKTIHTLCSAVRSGGEKTYDAVSEFLCDSYYLIEQCVGFSCISLINTEGGIQIFNAILRMMEREDYLCREESLKEMLEAEREQRYVEDDELNVIYAAVCHAVVARLSDYRNLTLRLAENCICSLRFLKEWNFDDFYSENSLLEKALDEATGGEYSRCGKRTKAYYRRRTAEYAKKKKITQVEAAQKEGSHFAKPVYRRWVGGLYFVCVLGGTLLLYLFTAWVCHFHVWIPLLMLLPLSELSKQITETIFERIRMPLIIPALDLETIPEEGRCLTVITTLLTGKGEDDAFYKKLEDYYLANRDENVKFGILGDLKDASQATMSKDEAALEYAMNRIEALNLKYNNAFCLFVRRRSFSGSEKKYVAWERKRGAVIELVKYIHGEETTFSTVIGDLSFLQKVKYIITLDSDTELKIGSVREMVGAMLHSANRPVIENGVVKSGYAIMQPRVTTSLESASRSYFSVMLTGSGGIDIYSSAAFDTYQTLFGEGIFCGKGIFDVDVFYQLIPDAFPEERVLSHDLLEGAILRAGYLSDVELSDSCPKNPGSFFQRMHRWFRGDIQAVAFAGRRAKTHNGSRRKNPINVLSRYKLYDNVRRVLLPISASVSILSTLVVRDVSGLFVLSFSVLYLIYPLLYDMARLLPEKNSNKNIRRKFYSLVLPRVFHSLVNVFFNLSGLFYTASLALDALLRCFFRMHISHRHMLEWTTASDGDRKNKTGVSAYLKKMAFSVLFGFLLVVFSPLIPVKVMGILFVIFPVFCAFLSGEYKAEKRLTGSQKREIATYAADTWKYYEQYVGKYDNYLPPDNHQYSPLEVTAHRTSPTNIGLYMLSCLAARDFSIIDTETMNRRLSLACSSLEKMKKWHGHLYNWYDTHTLSVIGTPYISSVDSGNFVTSILTLCRGLRQYVCESTALLDLINRLEILYKAADFSYLYKKNRNLFSIGYNEAVDALDEGCYDIYMSEARTTSYYATAIGAIPPSHWASLGRPITGKDGYIGLASWSGSAFEYFMPALFLPVYQNSLSYEALRFAYRQQSLYNDKKVFGVSESGYFAFDSEMNYQYKAFGVFSLALKRTKEKERVIAPYSTFLMLPMAASGCLTNLKRLKKLGLYGPCGFFEAVDLTPDRVGSGSAVVRSYMSHHVGMILLACANACFDGIMNTRFMEDPQMSCARSLLCERIPVDARMRGERPKERNDVPRDSSRNFFKYEREHRNGGGREPEVVLLSNGKSRLFSSGVGNNQTLNFYDGKDCITKNGISFYLSSTRECQNVLKQSPISRDVFLKYLNETSEYKAETIVGLSSDSSCLMIRSICDFKTEGNLFLYFEPVMMPYDSYKRHPAFFDLSIESFYDTENRMVFWKRRKRERDEKEKWMGIYIPSGKFYYETSKSNILSPLYGEKEMVMLSRELDNGRVGACVDPVCAARVPVTKRGRCIYDFYILYGSSEQELLAIRQTILEMKGKYLKNSILGMHNIRRYQYSSSGLEEQGLFCVNRMLYAIENRKSTSFDLGTHVRIVQLWEYGISGDLPIITVSIGRREIHHTERQSVLESFICAHRYLRMMGIECELVILYTERNTYGEESKKELISILDNVGSGYLCYKKGGVFPVSLQGNREVFEVYSCLFLQENEMTPEFLCAPLAVTNQEEELAIGSFERDSNKDVPDGLKVRGGVFQKNGFLVRKGEQKAPWSYLYCSENFGTFLTQNSLGYTWYKNASEMRLTPWSNDIYKDFEGEKLLLEYCGNLYDLCRCANGVTYERGQAVYRGKAGQLSFSVYVSVDVSLCVKTVRVALENKTKDSIKCRVCYRVKPVMGNGQKNVKIGFALENGTVYFSSVADGIEDRIGFLCQVGEGYVRKDGDTASIFSEPELSPESFGYLGFLLGVCTQPNDQEYGEITAKYRTFRDMEQGAQALEENILKTVGSMTLESQDQALDELFNFYLPYQALYARIYARTGFYQSSGAYGFRDQLQDSLAALYYHPEITKKQILACAAHQYQEGDVMHWWHETSGGEQCGVRTHCSDDYLWLVYVLSKYTMVSGDYDFMNETAPYLYSEPLGQGEKDRFEKAIFSDVSESLYLHCRRAVDYSMRNGIHGLPLFEGGDWNDGMNRVGVLGKGESVWLALFSALTLDAFIPLCRLQGDQEAAVRYGRRVNELCMAVEKYCYDEKWYIRGFYDNGNTLGAKNNNHCRIDLLPQAFAAIVNERFGCLDEQRVESALQSMYFHLFDKKNKILRLFWPPFDKPVDDPGYIAGYVPGVRENGGQYTHAAVWGAYGMFAGGHASKGYELLSALNPIRRGMDMHLSEKYREEPYFLAGDIYSGNGIEGRGGWSIYTGGAAWYYRLILERLLGYREEEGGFSVFPALSEEFPDFQLTVAKNETVYTIRASLGDRNSYMLDGKEGSNRFLFDGGRHFVKLTITL